MKSQIFISFFLAITIVVVLIFIQQQQNAIIYKKVLSPPQILVNYEVPKRRIISADVLFNKVNEWRIAHGYGFLAKDEVLCELARKRLPEIIETYSHDLVHDDWPVYMKRYGYTFMGENLARDYESEEAIVYAWEQSPKHLKNLVSNSNRSCIAVENSEYSVIKNHIVQELGQLY